MEDELVWTRAWGGRSFHCGSVVSLAETVSYSMVRQSPHLLELSILSPILGTQEVSCKEGIWSGREGLGGGEQEKRGGSAGFGGGKKEMPELRMK